MMNLETIKSQIQNVTEAQKSAMRNCLSETDIALYAANIFPLEDETAWKIKVVCIACFVETQNSGKATTKIRLAS